MTVFPPLTANPRISITLCMIKNRRPECSTSVTEGGAPRSTQLPIGQGGVASDFAGVVVLLYY